MCSNKTLSSKIDSKQIYPMGCSLPITDLEHLHLMSLFSFISMADIKATGSYMFYLHCICFIFLFFPLFFCLLLDWVFLLLHLISSSDSLFVMLFNILNNFSDACNLYLYSHILSKILYRFTCTVWILWQYASKSSPPIFCSFTVAHFILMWDMNLQQIATTVFPVVMYGCESWTIGWVLKNWCFWTVVLEKTLDNPLDCKEINPEYSQEGLMLKDWWSNTLATQCEEPTHWKNPLLGKIKGRRRRGWQRMRWLDIITDSMDMN